MQQGPLRNVRSRIKGLQCVEQPSGMPRRHVFVIAANEKSGGNACGGKAFSPMDGEDGDTGDVRQKYIIVIRGQRRFENRVEGGIYEVSSALKSCENG